MGLLVCERRSELGTLGEFRKSPLMEMGRPALGSTCGELAAESCEALLWRHTSLERLPLFCFRCLPPVNHADTPPPPRDSPVRCLPAGDDTRESFVPARELRIWTPPLSRDTESLRPKRGLDLVPLWLYKSSRICCGTAWLSSSTMRVSR